MATRASGNIPARRTGPQRAGITVQQHKYHVDSSGRSIFAQNQDSTSSLKQTPNPPKSIRTPTTHVSKQQSKRPAPSHTAHKPTSSPNPTLRSSAFSSKTAATDKAGPVRKQSSQYTRPVNDVKKRFIYVKKQDIGTSTAAATEEQCTSPIMKVEVSNAYNDVPQPEQNLKDRESPSINGAREDQAIDQLGSCNETKEEDVSVPVPEPISNVPQTKPGYDDHLKNDTQDITHAQETVISNPDQEVSEGPDIDEIKKRETDEHVAHNPTSEIGETDKEAARALLSDYKKEVVGAESQLVGVSKETEAVQEEKRETEKVAAKAQVIVKGKKLESVVSNDVIEETASKLREQRKNKVKALAGAFETVISLQEQK